MKKLLVLSIIIITACSPKDELPITQDEISITQNSISIKKDKSSFKDEKKLFYLTKETAVLLCGGKSRIIDSKNEEIIKICLLYTSPSPRDLSTSRMPSSA